MFVVFAFTILTIVGVAMLVWISRHSKERQAALVLLVGMLATLAILPRTVKVFGDIDLTHSGVTASVPLLATYHLVIIVATVHFMFFDKFRIPKAHTLFLIATPLMIWFLWGGGTVQWAGYVHYFGAILAWGIGYTMARKLSLNDPSSTIWAFLLTGVMLLQLALTALQVSGVTLPLWLGGIDRDATTRAFGSLSNPANLSKVTFYFLLILLPLSTSKIQATRRWAMWGIFAAVAVTALTVSRANMAAVGVMLAIWALIVPGRIKGIHRLGIIGAIGVSVWVFAGEFLTRFTTDDLDPRSDLLQAALLYLPEYFWGGLGVNSYVPVIGQFDAVTAQGIPVHNTFLLALMEMGLPLAILFFTPIIFLALRTLRAVRKGRKGNIFLWALFASLPGHLAIMWTGWGALSGFILVMLFFILGIVDRQTSREQLEESPQLDPERQQLART